MPDPTVPIVEINLDRVRHLVLDFNALAAAEEVLKESVLSTDFWKSISAKKLLVLVWAGLLDEDPNITLDQVKSLLRRRNTAPIVQKIMEAWGVASPEPDPTQRADRSSPGSNSGPSGGTTSVLPN
ncbi:MAG TPA: hypothetical protein VKW06_00620 [Candidatus Angelobacter sp.]|nr:hypothetical protein [Candidatus Angelobacter sp.]